MNKDEAFMRLALKEAEAAAEQGEVPVGAIIVVDGQVVSRAGNKRETLGDPTAHAEILALREAAARLDTWRLSQASIYVTVEPCLMCMGALLMARVARLVYGCADAKAGACGSLYDISCDPRLNHRIAVTRGVLADAAQEVLQKFFRQLRGQLD